MHSGYINNDMNVGFFSYFILGVEKCQEQITEVQMLT